MARAIPQFGTEPLLPKGSSLRRVSRAPRRIVPPMCSRSISGMKTTNGCEQASSNSALSKGHEFRQTLESARGAAAQLARLPVCLVDAEDVASELDHHHLLHGRQRQVQALALWRRPRGYLKTQADAEVRDSMLPAELGGKDLPVYASHTESARHDNALSRCCGGGHVLVDAASRSASWAIVAVPAPIEAAHRLSTFSRRCFPAPGQKLLPRQGPSSYASACESGKGGRRRGEGSTSSSRRGFW
eukprot:scaffold657_cov245-Pinguiococcus_pyrenoidosus.AAC.5